jgi:hypothetical protein
MALTMRPTGLGHGVYKDDIDYSVFCGEWCIGTLRISNQVATLETAKAEFQASWKQWKAWAKLEELP